MIRTLHSARGFQEGAQHQCGVRAKAYDVRRARVSQGVVASARSIVLLILLCQARHVQAEQGFVSQGSNDAGLGVAATAALYLLA